MTALSKFIVLFGVLHSLSTQHSYAQPTDDEIRRLLASEMQRQQIPGAQLLVVHNKQILFSASAGLANIEFSAPVTDSTVFSINSIAKVFAGTAIMKLAEENKLALDKPIATYLSDLPVAWRPITLRQLLSHTSGLPYIEDEATDGLVGNRGETAAWQFVQTLPLRFKPGEQFDYNATNYLLIQKVIEKYRNQPYETYIRLSQLTPTGMRKTVFGNSFDVLPNKAPTYSYYTKDPSTGDRVKGSHLIQTHETFPLIFRADAGMFSTARDLARWIVALQNSQLLTPQSVKAMWQPTKLSNGQKAGFGGMMDGYALGWPTVGRKSHPAVAPIGGGRAAFMIYPEDDLTIILLTNLTGCSPEEIVDKIAEYYFSK